MFSLAGRLLVTADIFATALAAISWYTLMQDIDYYRIVYDDVNNTTKFNYEMLLSMRKDMEGLETQTWIATGIAAGLLIYTVADAVWLKAAFPVKPGYAFTGGSHVLYANLRF